MCTAKALIIALLLKWITHTPIQYVLHARSLDEQETRSGKEWIQAFIKWKNEFG